MGIFTSNRITTSRDISIDESAVGQAAVFELFTENVKNDMLLFNTVLESDIREVCAIKLNESTEEHVRAIHESAIGDIITKVKNFVIKIGSAIKGILKNAIMSITTKLGRDNEKLVDKYSNFILSKDLSDLKYEWRTNKINKNIILDLDSLIVADDMYEELKMNDPINMESELIKLSDTEPMSLDSILTKLVGRQVLSTNIKTEIEDYQLESLKPTEGMSKDRVIGIERFLIDYKSYSKSLKKIDNDFEKLAKSRLKTLDSIKRATDIDSIDMVYKYRGANVLMTNIKREQESIGIFIGAFLSVYKDAMIMARKAYISAIKFSNTSTNESTTLLRVEHEVDESVVQEYFEGIYA